MRACARVRVCVRESEQICCAKRFLHTLQIRAPCKDRMCGDGNAYSADLASPHWVPSWPSVKSSVFFSTYIMPGDNERLNCCSYPKTQNKLLCKRVSGVCVLCLKHHEVETLFSQEMTREKPSFLPSQIGEGNGGRKY